MIISVLVSEMAHRSRCKKRWSHRPLESCFWNTIHAQYVVHYLSKSCTKTGSLGLRRCQALTKRHDVPKCASMLHVVSWKLVTKLNGTFINSKKLLEWKCRFITLVMRFNTLVQLCAKMQLLLLQTLNYSIIVFINCQVWGAIITRNVSKRVFFKVSLLWRWSRSSSP